MLFFFRYDTKGFIFPFSIYLYIFEKSDSPKKGNSFKRWAATHNFIILRLLNGVFFILDIGFKLVISRIEMQKDFPISSKVSSIYLSLYL